MRTIPVSSFITESTFQRFHLYLLLLCSFIIICDGYDMFLMGTILPVLIKEWNLSLIEAGTISSYALVGMMLGALVFGPIADKIGRKKVILLCTSIFSVFTFLSGFSHTPTVFSILRFIAGLGLGGVMPNLIAIVTEYAPGKMKSTLVAVMFSGHALGGVVAALAGIYIMPVFGWKGVVFLGGIPLLFIPFLMKALPDTANFYVLRNQTDKLAATLRKIRPDYTPKPDDKFVLETESADTKGFPVIKLFQQNRGLSTVLFWISFFMCLLVMYGLNTWLPKLMISAGFAMGSSLSFLLMLNIGAILGAIGGGKLADRFGSKKVLVTFFFLACLSLIAISYNPGVAALYLLLIVAGATTTGTQIICNAYVSQYYPSKIRSTGIGWALGVGRIGGIAGPSLGGLLLNQHFSLQVNFLFFAVPCIIAALAIWMVQERTSHLHLSDQNEPSPSV